MFRYVIEEWRWLKEENTLLIITGVHNGFGKHILMLTPDQITTFTKVSLTQAPYCLRNFNDALNVIAHDTLCLILKEKIPRKHS